MFYPAKTPTAKMLDFYVRTFDKVELNNSFYRLPTAKPSIPGAMLRPRTSSSPSKPAASSPTTKRSKIPSMLSITFSHAPPTLGQNSALFCFNFLLTGASTLPALKIFSRFFLATSICLRVSRAFLDQSGRSFHSQEIQRRLLHLRTCRPPFASARHRHFVYVCLHGPAGGKYQGSYSKEKLRAWARQIEV